MSIGPGYSGEGKREGRKRLVPESRQKSMNQGQLQEEPGNGSKGLGVGVKRGRVERTGPFTVTVWTLPNLRRPSLSACRSKHCHRDHDEALPYMSTCGSAWPLGAVLGPLGAVLTPLGAVLAPPGGSSCPPGDSACPPGGSACPPGGSACALAKGHTERGPLKGAH